MTESVSGTGRVRLFLLLILTASLTVFGSVLLYLCDNKYTVEGPEAWQGVLTLSDESLALHPVLFLVEGWAFYNGRLLTPADFYASNLSPDAYIYIGQYGGFDAGDYSASPHGSATYRMRIQLPEEPRLYTLELPEIFSSYRLYLNGKETAVMGIPEPESYLAETGVRTVNIEAGGDLEILLAVSDYSHLYSGMVYPPAFGEPEAVAKLLDARLAFRMLLAVFAFAVGLLAVMVGVLSGRKRSAMLYGVLCLFFIGYTAYPIWYTFSHSGTLLYAIENFSFCAMLAIVMLLERTLHSERESLSRCFVGFGCFMCLFSLALPLLLPGGNILIMGAYSFLISAYQLFTAGFLTITAVRVLLRDGVYSKVMLFGFIIFDTALVMDRILPLFEPRVTGWFIELSSFALVLCVGVAVAQELAAGYREGAILKERQSSMNRLAEMQRTSHELLMKQAEETKTIRHDLRHHFLMIEGFLQNKEYHRIGAYLQEVQPFIQSPGPLSHVENVVVDVLVRYYERLAGRENIVFDASLNVEKELDIPDADLCTVLSNLLENAVEACRKQKNGNCFILLGMTQQETTLLIRVENSAGGTIKRQGTGFLSSKEEGHGYGLKSIKTIAERSGGEAGFTFDDASGVFTSTVLLKI